MAHKKSAPDLGGAAMHRVTGPLLPAACLRADLRKLSSALDSAIRPAAGAAHSRRCHLAPSACTSTA